jgi:hypothetical protein
MEGFGLQLLPQSPFPAPQYASHSTLVVQLTAHLQRKTLPLHVTEIEVELHVPGKPLHVLLSPVGQIVEA